MALFFDAPWFDQRLAERGISRSVMAAAAGLGSAELALVFKDQREISAAETAIFAELLGVSVEEVALHAGVSTPVADAGGPEERVTALEARVAVLEAAVAALLKR